MSYGHDDDAPKGPEVLMLVPGKDGKLDQLYKRRRNEDCKYLLEMAAIPPREIDEFTVNSLFPHHHIDANFPLATFVGERARARFGSHPNAGFDKIIRTNQFSEETISKLAQLAELINESAKFSILAGCDDGKIRLFNFTFDGEGKHERSVETFNEPVVFFPNHYYRTKTELVKTLQDRIDKQAQDLQRYFDPAYDQMNFAGFQ